MLLATWQLIQKNEQNTTELTAGLAVQAEPGGSRIPGPDGTDNTVVAPGQTIRIWERAEPP